MEKALTIFSDGSSFTTNFMLDDVIDCFDNLGVEHNDELIKKLTIDKIEYARKCLVSFAISIAYPFNKESPHFEDFKKAI